MADEIVNYRDLSECEKDEALSRLREVGFIPARGGVKQMKCEMEKSQDGSLPQYFFVRRGKEVIGYMFLIGEAEKISELFPWWAVDNSDELPLETDIRLLQCGAEVCEKSGCFRLADRLKGQIEEHKKYIGRRPEELSR